MDHVGCGRPLRSVSVCLCDKSRMDHVDCGRPLRSVRCNQNPLNSAIEEDSAWLEASFPAPAPRNSKLCMIGSPSPIGSPGAVTIMSRIQVRSLTVSYYNVTPIGHPGAGGPVRARVREEHCKAVLDMRHMRQAVLGRS